MARKNKKMWMRTPAKQAKPQVPAIEKQLIIDLLSTEKVKDNIILFATYF